MDGESCVGVLIVYATEYGTCETMAHALSGHFKKLELPSGVIAMEDYHSLIESLRAKMKKEDAESKFVHIFIVSTVGQGDPPAAAEAFLKNLKSRAYNLPYVQVVGVGHSSFEFFNSFGKKLFQQLQKYSRSQPLGDHPILIDMALRTPKGLTTKSIPDASAEVKKGFVTIQQPLTDLIVTKIALKTLHAMIETQPEELLISYDLAIDQQVASTAKFTKDLRGRPSRFADRGLFEAADARVTLHKSSKGSQARGLHLLNIEVNDFVDTCVGKAVHLWTPVASEIMTKVSGYFANAARGELPETSTFMRSTRIVGQTPPPRSGKFTFPKGSTLEDVLLYMIDWTSSPSEELLGEIYSVISNLQRPDGDVALPELSELVQAVTEAQLSLFECLEILCKGMTNLPISLLIILPHTRARQYTLASAPERVGFEKTNFELLITESFTTRTAKDSTEREHTGRVCGWLRDLAGRSQSEELATFSEKTSRIMLWTSPLASVCNLMTSLKGGIWCGAGSGCAMFRGFIDERIRRYQKSKNKKPSPPTSVFLCLRNRSEYDLVSSGRFELAVELNVVSQIIVCLTREAGPKLFRIGDGLHVITTTPADARITLADLFKQPSLDLSERSSMPLVADLIGCKSLEAMGDDHLFVVSGGCWLKDHLAEALPADAYEKLSSTYRFVCEVW